MGVADGSKSASDARSGRMLGTVMVDRRNPNRPGHVRPDGRELELSYVLLPDVRGRGIAEAACRDLLARVACGGPWRRAPPGCHPNVDQKALALAGFGFVACGAFSGIQLRAATADGISHHL